jgi:hypothetical protein
MKSKILLILLATIFTGIYCDSSAQNYRLDAGVRVGGANYLGDIGGKFLSRRGGISDIKLQNTGISIGGFARYSLSPKLSLNASLQFGRISGADSLTTNPGRNNRNLSFVNNIKEFALALEVEIYERYNVGGNHRYRVDYAFFLFTGAGFFMHNPKTYFEGNINGTEYSGYQELQPLQTEGISYSLNGIAFINGIGMHFTIAKSLRIGWRIGLRTTQTDYLDDISSFYQPTKEFSEDENGILARTLADRTDPKNQASSESASRIRGFSQNDDSYVFSTFSIAHVLRGKKGRYKKSFHNGYMRKRGKRTNVNRFFDF